ncbi:hypothetical protein LOD99_2328 [Oopsacas minuta]|uniref:WW domain-containing protein n=1 Tax=Oopsacas minuta TaxID=111878 RepID=A0AAV7K375_9METZ|nr:hypothetical protein LOD99_2328 [Oopsacas minuta]
MHREDELPSPLPPLPDFNPKRHKSDPFDISSRPSTALSNNSDVTINEYDNPQPDISLEHITDEGLDNLLPQGWSKRTDLRTGMTYYENHWTLSTTWADPRTLNPSILSEHDWSQPALGWNMLQDEQAQYYWVHHDSQTSSWSGPRERRVRKLLNILKDRYIQEDKVLRSGRDKIQELRSEILKLLASNASDENVFSINDKLELECKLVEKLGERLEFFQTLMEETVDELTGVKNQGIRSSEISRALHEAFLESHFLYTSQHKLIFDSELNFSDIPPVYDLPVDKVQVIHLLPDCLTPKTSLEMSLELRLLQHYNELIKSQLNKLVERLELEDVGLDGQLEGFELRPVYLELIGAGYEELIDRFLLN